MSVRDNAANGNPDAARVIGDPSEGKEDANMGREAQKVKERASITKGKAEVLVTSGLQSASGACDVDNAIVTSSREVVNGGQPVMKQGRGVKTGAGESAGTAKESTFAERIVEETAHSEIQNGNTKNNAEDWVEGFWKNNVSLFSSQVVKKEIDNISVMFKRQSELDKIVASLEEYSKVAGSKVNFNKSKHLHPFHLSRFPTPDDDVSLCLVLGIARGRSCRRRFRRFRYSRRHRRNGYQRESFRTKGEFLIPIELKALGSSPCLTRLDNRDNVMRAVFFNARSISNKTSLIYDLLDDGMDLACIIETWLDENAALILAAAIPRGFSVIHCPRLHRRESTEALRRKMASPLIEVDPKQGLVDKPFGLKVSFLPPNKPITLYSQLEQEKRCWEAFAHYISDSEGTVRVNQQESLGGTYSGREPMGLIWSMKPPPESKTDPRFRKEDVTVPDLVDISVFDGHVSGDFLQKKPLASVGVERCYMAPGVKRVEIRQNGIVGTLFLPPGSGPFPAVLDLQGAGGGLYEYRVALLASNGFASLTAAYMSHKDLPGPMGVVNIGPDYFEKAFQMLRSLPLVAADRIALMGLCFGAIISLFMAAEVPSINPKCLVCVSGAYSLPFGYMQGDLLRFLLSQTEKIKVDENGHMICKSTFLLIPEDPTQKVKVGKLQCPLLLVSGEDDCIVPAVESAEDIRKVMEAAGNVHLLTSVSYPGAGHLIEPPYCPHASFSKMTIPSQNKKVVVRWGGEPQLHACAQEDSWKKILEFLRQHLIPDQSATLERSKP
ncbi:bile acid-CoA:amino acid N-acyltransferase-like [Latimeria chalumnae]|uniref:bile acid-CoA:amino acid N-acyltransferase-like n=1 Tax=Latimeria chalumnae TaxID=7897 RepID=UPI00313A930E